mmetsp:Transcript_14918/g.48712  ORF Transcript_14918/g.48712 Transcript_14918/m.48712 type:complete len:495 (+) Transcript_14918:3-1487(+)
MRLVCSHVVVSLFVVVQTTEGLLGLGVDLGTSGVRTAVVDGGGAVIGEAKASWSDEEGRSPETWVSKLRETLLECPGASEATHIAVSGTSASLLAVDADGRVSRGPMMYCDAIDDESAFQQVLAFAPEGHTTRSKTSALAKLVQWHLAAPFAHGERCAHQADYVAAALAAGFESEDPTKLVFSPGLIQSDWHNALKLGFDVEALAWPAWMTKGLFPAVGLDGGCLPSDVLKPGGTTSSRPRTVSKKAAAQWGLREGAAIVGGTTDSIAAFLACSFDGKSLIVDPGRAVTSLGSTTALKLVSKVKVDDSTRGVYSHRLDDAWLVGGASNAGCRVLRYFGFDDDELERLSDDDLFFGFGRQGDEPVVNPLCDRGERFPVNDPDLEPRLPPFEKRRTDESDDAYAARRRTLLRRLLRGIADVEQRGYAALADLGATPLVAVTTAGGGAKNKPWRRLRSDLLAVPVVDADYTDAAFGAAVLALTEHPRSASSSEEKAP